FFFSSRRRHTRFSRDWSSDVCSSDWLLQPALATMSEAELRDFLGSWYDIVGAALGLEAGHATQVPDPTGVRDGLDWVVTRLAVQRAPLVLLLDDLHWADAE